MYSTHYCPRIQEFPTYPLLTLCLKTKQSPISTACWHVDWSCRLDLYGPCAGSHSYTKFLSTDSHARSGRQHFTALPLNYLFQNDCWALGYEVGSSPFRDEHSRVICSYHFDQLWVSILTADYCREKPSRPRLRAALIYVYKHKYSLITHSFSMTTVVSFALGPVI